MNKRFFMGKKLLIIGYGSAGRRYAQLAKKIYKNLKITILTEQHVIQFKKISSLNQINKLDPDYIIISSPTSYHLKHLIYLNKIFKNKKILIEKPLFHKFQKIVNKNKVFVGYNLRNLKIIQFFKSMIRKNRKNINDVSFINHSYLPNWRKNIDYSESSSAKKKYGGGVILDCSHELDLASWIFGNINIVFVEKSKKSNLKIETEDNCKIYGKKKGISFTFDFNYYSPQKKRQINILGDNLKININLISNKFLLIKDKKKTFKKFNKNDMKKSYELIIQDLFSKKNKYLVDYNSALKTQKLIQSIKNF